MRARLLRACKWLVASEKNGDVELIGSWGLFFAVVILSALLIWRW